MNTLVYATLVALAGSFIWWAAYPVVRGIDPNQERGDEE